MNQHLACMALLVDDYDTAIRYYTAVLGFELVEDNFLSDSKRWVLVKPKGTGSCHLLLAKAANPVQQAAVGNQSGGRVFLFLHTDNFERDYNAYKNKGVQFIREPVKESYGTVAVFEDLYGNRWDLIQPTGKV